MTKKLFIIFAVACVVAAVMLATPLVALASPFVASDNGTMALLPIVLAGTLAFLMVVAFVAYRGRYVLEWLPSFAFAVGRQLRYGARDHAPIPMWRIFAVAVLVVTCITLTFATASGIVALSPLTILAILAMLTLFCAAATRLWRVRDHAPISVGRPFTMTTVLAIVVALSTIGFAVLTAASPPAVLVSILAFLTIVASLTVTVFAYVPRIRDHAPINTVRYEEAHDIAKNTCATDAAAPVLKRKAGQEVRSYAPTLAVSGAPG